jgi:hypothetical protein
MKLALPLAAAMLLGTGLLAPAAARNSYLETEPHTYPVTAKHRVRLTFPVGELKVLPGDASEVRFEVRIRCKGGSEDRCEELASKLRLESEDRNGTLSISLDQYPKWNCRGFNVTAVLHVPSTIPVEVDMGVGQLTIEGVHGDVDVDLGVGEADIRTLRALANNVSVDTGIGDAAIHGTRGEIERRSFIGSHASWSAGSGRSSVRLHVGVGDATVRLD